MIINIKIYIDNSGNGNLVVSHYQSNLYTNGDVKTPVTAFVGKKLGTTINGSRLPIVMYLRMLNGFGFSQPKSILQTSSMIGRNINQFTFACSYLDCSWSATVELGNDLVWSIIALNNIHSDSCQCVFKPKNSQIAVFLQNSELLSYAIPHVVKLVEENFKFIANKNNITKIRDVVHALYPERTIGSQPIFLAEIVTDSEGESIQYVQSTKDTNDVKFVEIVYLNGEKDKPLTPWIGQNIGQDVTAAYVAEWVKMCHVCTNSGSAHPHPKNIRQVRKLGTPAWQCVDENCPYWIQTVFRAGPKCWFINTIIEHSEGCQSTGTVDKKNLISLLENNSSLRENLLKCTSNEKKMTYLGEVGFNVTRNILQSTLLEMKNKAQLSPVEVMELTATVGAHDDNGASDTKRARFNTAGVTTDCLLNYHSANEL